LSDWHRIASHNEALIRSYDVIIANLTPFRRPSADAGTVYEVGFMRAARPACLGLRDDRYAICAAPLDYVVAHGGSTTGADRSLRDADGMLIGAKWPV
jgi:nucleoside 2-deoxyribosyltransferase